MLATELIELRPLTVPDSLLARADEVIE
jgi:hypothetical protein